MRSPFLSSPFRITYLLVLLIVCSSQNIDAQRKTEYYDGPYIFKQDDSLRVQWVEAGHPHDTLIAQKDATLFDIDSLPRVDLRDLDFEVDNKASYTNIDKVIAISDIHGQYDIMIQLLRAHGIINEQNEWIFENGHLVIVGDNFDRGDKVIDILWFLFQLQKQAELTKGRVHVLLGNHEIMVLNNDLRYLNRKYYYTSALFRTRYDQLFRKGSVLGDWLSSHKVLTSINRNLYVHGGISTTILGLDYSIEEINNSFISHLIRREQEEIPFDSSYSPLYFDNGPLWYRGYFDTAYINQNIIDSILTVLDQDRIVVGHTSLERISPLLKGKVIAIDCSIKLGKTGQVLIIEDDEYYIGEMDGQRSALMTLEKRASLFENIYNYDGIPKLKIITDINRLIRRSSKEEYQESLFELYNQQDELQLSLNARLRSRGNMRKKVCRFPPVKFDFDKADLTSLGFVENDDLKLVFPCTNHDKSQKLLYKEFFLYELYNLIDTNGMHAKLVDITISDGTKDKFQFTGFLVEDEDEYAYRKKAVVVETGIIKAPSLHRSSFLKMLFFQYMIANTDWAVSSKHNLELVKLPNIKRVVALPYDFDYSGFVGQSYAVPHESLPIEDVHERYFHPYKVTKEEFYSMVDFYNSMQQEINDLCDLATYMDEDTRKDNKKYLAVFFDLLLKPDRIISDIVK